MDSYPQVCERLLSAANASLVALVDESGHEVARAGAVEGFDSKSTAESFFVMLAANGEFTSAFHEGDRTNIHVALAAPGLILVVVFDVRSSLGLVRLRAKQAIEELSRSPAGGSSGSGGPGGSPAPAYPLSPVRRPS